MVIEYEGDKSRIYSQDGIGETFDAVLTRRLNRRDLVRGTMAASAIVIGGSQLDTNSFAQATPEATPTADVSPTFTGLAQNTNIDTTVAEGHLVTPFLSWGDPLFSDSPVFDPLALTAATQAKQFGYNCDFVGYIPLDEGIPSTNGILTINHEYTNPEIMFPGYLTANPEYVEGSEDIAEFIVNSSKEIVDTELEAHGMSIVEIALGADGKWAPVVGSKYNRRITATTPFEVTGPAAGSPLLQTSADPTGTAIVGTLNNCAGGTTPWGTVVSGEENFNQYFGNLDALGEASPVYALHTRYGIPTGVTERLWETFYDRFDVAKEPNEPLRFGWAIEIDPMDPTSTPKKRTALGRNKHEGHRSLIAVGGQAVVYGGDDERFDYAYKFVTAGSYDAANREANLNLLDEGTLYVAKFNDDGSGNWMPLIFGEGELVAANGFESQADVLIKTRLAADAIGATKMDRPEDFETNPVDGKVYLVCTNNKNRGVEDNPGVDSANPRVENLHGHIIEITEADGDHAATDFAWDLFLVAGEPSDDSTYYAGFPKDQVSSISCPDNVTFDNVGNLWISSDGQPGTLGTNDGLYAVATEGANRGNLKLFFTAVPGSEVSGPVFVPDNKALFTSIQHPGEGGSYDAQITSWPGTDGPPRPTVVIITREDGGIVGR